MTMMAATSEERSVMEPSRTNPGQNQPVDRLKMLYPMVNEEETPLPRAWSPKDKYNYIGLSQNNLRVHYKGRWASRPHTAMRPKLDLPHRIFAQLSNVSCRKSSQNLPPTFIYFPGASQEPGKYRLKMAELSFACVRDLNKGISWSRAVFVHPGYFRLPKMLALSADFLGITRDFGLFSFRENWR